LAEKPGSVERVRLALRHAGLDDTISEFPDGTRTAADAASAVGCEVSQIVKSLVFCSKQRPVLVLTSGSNSVDETKVSKLLGSALESAKGRWVRDVTGFAIGGVSPIAHKSQMVIFIDEDLMALPKVWAAAGSPKHVFSILPDQLKSITGGKVADIRAEAD